MDDDIRLYLEEIRQQSFFGNNEQTGSLKYNVEWYRDSAKNAHRAFRGVGFLTIVLSVSLPFLISIWPGAVDAAKCNQGWINFWDCYPLDKSISTISWAIALAAGANGFFHWGKNWQSRTEAYLRLERLLMEWEIAVQKPNLQIENVSDLTMRLVLDARETIKAETGVFFEEIQFPEVGGNRQDSSGSQDTTPEVPSG